ncbi:HipA domain-containing protein [Saccharothrix yanglingensis]|uniref:HipA domain-containing protein n=1 Tax=Saccharothrix yanglingensis TaxID=659496 RepID=UPI0027D2D5DB|nr:HipA domain-containing protein [Saccharothrix yanglingensis]
MTSCAAPAYRGRDEARLVEVVRRLAFCVVVGNGDAHLKNWSLIYRNKKMPVLSPVYDSVSTAPYVPIGESEDLGPKFAGSKRFANVNRASFAASQNHLQRRLPEIRTNLADVAMHAVEEVRSHWPEHEAELAKSPEPRREIDDWVDFHSTRLLRSR